MSNQSNQDLYKKIKDELSQNSNGNELSFIVDSVSIDIRRIDNDGYNLLYYAIEDQNKMLIELFINRGIDINEKCGEDKTPLHQAISCSNDNIIAILLRLGAKIDDRDLIEAQNYNNDRIYSFLLHEAYFKARSQTKEAINQTKEALKEEIKLLNFIKGDVLHNSDCLSNDCPVYKEILLKSKRYKKITNALLIIDLALIMAMVGSAIIQHSMCEKYKRPILITIPIMALSFFLVAAMATFTFIQYVKYGNKAEQIDNGNNEETGSEEIDVGIVETADGYRLMNDVDSNALMV